MNDFVYRHTPIFQIKVAQFIILKKKMLSITEAENSYKFVNLQTVVTSMYDRKERN